MEKPIKGGYILISLGLIALSTSYSGSINYDRISKTKKRIVLTGIKVADTVMPDITVKPIYGNGTITFEDVYGYDIVISSNNSVSVSEHTSDIPNVEEAPSGTIVEALGLDEDGKVVKATVSSGTKLYKHYIDFGDGKNITAITNSSSLFERKTQGGPPRVESDGLIICYLSSSSLLITSSFNEKSIGTIYSSTLNSDNILVYSLYLSSTEMDVVSDTVTEL